MRTLSLNAKPKNKDIGLHNNYDKYTVSTRNERCQKIAEQQIVSTRRGMNSLYTGPQRVYWQNGGSC